MCFLKSLPFGNWLDNNLFSGGIGFYNTLPQLRLEMVGIK